MAQCPNPFLTTLVPDSTVTVTALSSSTILITNTIPGSIVTTSSATATTTLCSTAIPLCPTTLPVCPTPITSCATSTLFTTITTSLPSETTTSTSISTSTSLSVSTSPGVTSTVCPSTTPATTPLPPNTSTTPTSTPSSVPTSAPSSTVSSPTSLRPGTTSSSQITSFTTLIVTTMVNGSFVTHTSVAPVLQTGQDSSGSSSSNTGAIAGGVIGGIALLLGLVFCFWFGKKRGYFGGRHDDERFTDDIWNPSAHSPNAGGGGGGIVGLGVNHEEEEEDEGDRMSGGVMSEKGGAAAASLRPQPQGQGWYGGDQASMGYASDYRPNASEDHSYQRRSLQSSSGHGHVGPEPVPFYGGSPQMGYANQQQTSPPLHQTQNPQYYQANDYSNNGDQQETTLGGPSLSVSDHSDSGRTAATTGSSSATSHSNRVGGGGMRALTSFDNAPPLPALLPNAMYAASPPPPLPSSTINSGYSSPEPGINSNSTSATSIAPIPSPTGSGFAHSDAGERGRVDQLKRPKVIRTPSVDSFVMPSQFLGARIANADLTPDGPEKKGKIVGGGEAEEREERDSTELPYAALPLE